MVTVWAEKFQIVYILVTKDSCMLLTSSKTDSHVLVG